MAVDSDFIEILNKKLSFLNNVSTKEFNISLCPIKIGFDLKGLRAGIFKPKTNEIYLNKELCYICPDKVINEVLIHEIAHFIAYHIDKKAKPHGRLWKKIAYRLGLKNPKATHNLPVTPAKSLKTFRYSCKCKIHFITSIRHNKIINKKAKYFCKKCKAELKPE
jgi:SprT protein